MKLTSLKNTKRTLRSAKMAKAVPSLEEPEYPWGLELNLENQTIKKLGIDVANSSVGDEISFTAKAKISAISQSESRDGSHESMSIQITSMGWGKT